MQKGGETMLSGAGEFSVASSTNVELNIEVSTVAKMKAPKKRLLPFAPILTGDKYFFNAPAGSQAFPAQMEADYAIFRAEGLKPVLKRSAYVGNFVLIVYFVFQSTVGTMPYLWEESAGFGNTVPRLQAAAAVSMTQVLVGIIVLNLTALLPHLYPRWAANTSRWCLLTCMSLIFCNFGDYDVYLAAAGTSYRVEETRLLALGGHPSHWSTTARCAIPHNSSTSSVFSPTEECDDGAVGARLTYHRAGVAACNNDTALLLRNACGDHDLCGCRVGENRVVYIIAAVWTLATFSFRLVPKDFFLLIMYTAALHAIACGVRDDGVSVIECGMDMICELGLGFLFLFGVRNAEELRRSG